MGLFDFILKRNTETEIEPEVSDVLLRALLKNEPITREKAMMIPAVNSAVDFISNCVASMPIRLYRTDAGKVFEVEDDSRIDFLNGDTGDMLNGFQMKKAMVEDCLLGKGGYCFIQKKRNEVAGLYYVEDDRITVMKNQDPVYKDYTISVNGKSYKPHEFIKLLRNTKDGASGTGLSDEVSKAIETAYQTMLFQLKLMNAGGSKKGFLKSQNKLSQDAIDQLKDSWSKLYSKNEENVIVLNHGVEFQEAASSNAEMQLNESKRTLDDQIYSIFHIYGDFDRTFKEAVYPIVKSFECSLNKDLLLEKEKKNHYFAFDIKEITKASMTERFNAYKIAKETGFLTINEIRKEENKNFIEGLDVINVGLGAVLYDVNTNKYYTPNTDTVSDPNDGTNGSRGKERKEKEELPEDDGELPLKERFNQNHDGKTGRFASGKGGNAVPSNDVISETKITELEKNIKHKDILEKEFGQLNSSKIILTPPQRQHIIERHPNDLDLLEQNHRAIFSSPDYILKDGVDAKSVLYIKNLNKPDAEKTKKAKVLVRLSIGDDEKNKDNSVITFHRISDKTEKRLIKKNKLG